MSRGFLAFLIAACAFVLAAAPASAAAAVWPFRGVYVGGFSSTCPNGSAIPDDACAGATADMALQYPGFWTAPATVGYVHDGAPRQSGQSYIKIPTTINPAGIAFPVGYQKNVIAAQSCPGPAPGNWGPSYCLAGGWRDPANIQNDPSAGCTYQSGGNTFGGPRVYCDGSSVSDIEGYDFSAHGCVPVLLQYIFTPSQLTQKNNNFRNGPNCAPVEAVIQGYIGDSWNNWYIFGNTLCVLPSSIQQGQVETDPGGNFTIWGSGFNKADITATSTGCAAGYNSYTIDGSAQNVGSSSSPMTTLMHEDTTTLTITQLTYGTVATSYLGGNSARISGSTGYSLTTMNSSGTFDGMATVKSGSGNSWTIDGTYYAPPQTWYIGPTPIPLLQITNSISLPENFLNSVVDGCAVVTSGSAVGDCPLGQCGAPVAGVACPMAFGSAGFVALGTTGNVNASYSAVLHVPARPVSGGTNGDVVLTAMYFEGMAYNRTNGHGEVDIFGMPTSRANFKLNNVTVVLDANQQPADTTSPIYASNGNNGGTVTNMVVTNSVTIDNMDPTGSGIPMSTVAHTQFAGQTFTYTTFANNYMDGLTVVAPGLVSCFNQGNDTFTNAPNVSGNYEMESGHLQDHIENHATSEKCQ